MQLQFQQDLEDAQEARMVMMARVTAFMAWVQFQHLRPCPGCRHGRKRKPGLRSTAPTYINPSAARIAALENLLDDSSSDDDSLLQSLLT